MAVSDIFNIGQQGLAANRQALQTTSNNIANANTPGFTRQRAVMESRASLSQEGINLGGGVDVPYVIRIHDKFVDRQLVDESKSLGTFKSRAEGVKHIESLLTGGGEQLSHLVGDFFNRYRELSSNPEQGTMRSAVAEAARASVDGFRRLSDSLDSVKRDVDLRLESLVNEVNADASEFASLNQKISDYISSGQQANELLDHRDVLVRRLSQRCGFDMSEDDRGHLNFGLTGLGALIQGDTANQLVVGRTEARGDKADGSVDIFVKGPFGSVRVTPSFKEGELAGLLQVRDKYVSQAQGWLDGVAFQFGSAVNEVHKMGVGEDGVGGRDLFELGKDPKGAAAAIKLQDDVEKSFESISSGATKSPGDNKIALAIADLQNKALMPTDSVLKEGAENRYTLTESLNALVGQIGTQAAHESQLLDHQESIVNQLDNYRQSISGVSLEEEAANMMQQQAVFNAAAKTMKVGDELLQTILSLKS